jgi:sporulation protein YlmC with PRC-barrel domain
MNSDAVIRATDLSGRAVVDLDAAEKVGKVDRIVLDPDARRVAALLVSRGGTVSGDAMHMTVTASAIRAIGPDAVTIHRGAALSEQALAHIERLPRASDVIGRKVVSEDGKLLGRVDDVLIGRHDGRIIGYALADQDVLGKISGLIAGDRKRKHGAYLRAEADLRAGHDLIVAPDGAVAEDWSSADDASDAESVAASRTTAASSLPPSSHEAIGEHGVVKPMVAAPVPASPTAVPSVEWKEPTELPAARTHTWMRREDPSA